jgi:hypothetical protein
MEGVALVLIGAIMFNHSWSLLRLYPDGRTMGIFVGALGLAALATLTFDPMLLTGIGEDGSALRGANPVAEITILKLVIIVWAGYAVGVAAQAIWEFDERAIGFYSVVVAASSLVALIYYATTLLTPYGDDVQLSMIAAMFFLAVPPAMVFSYYAIPAFAALQQVAGWFLLVGGIGVTTTGLVIVSTLIEARGFAR